MEHLRKSGLALALLGSVLIMISVPTHARQAQKKKPEKSRADLMLQIQQAQQQSYSDQVQLRRKIESETDQRLESYRHQDFEFGRAPAKSKTARTEPKKKNSSKKPRRKATKLAVKPRTSGHYEELGEDQSGLGSWHDSHTEEPEVDFDQELREVSSLDK